jgi:hypothetical protein
MSIVGGFDLHRRQITFDYAVRETGEVARGRIAPADRDGLRLWLARLGDQGGDFVVERCTGWRFVVEELQAAGYAAHVAEPTQTAALKGNKKRAKTDRCDAQHLRELLAQGRVRSRGCRRPTCWRSARWAACTSTWSSSAASGSSGSRRSCSTRAYLPACPFSAPQAGRGWRAWSCRRRVAGRCTRRWTSIEEVRRGPLRWLIEPGSATVAW